MSHVRSARPARGPRPAAAATGARAGAPERVVTRALVAVDGSAPSIHAAHRAVELLGPTTAFTLLHVLEPPVPPVAGRPADPLLLQQLVDRAQDLSQRALSAADEAVGGGALRLRVSGLDPGVVICEVAADEHADVVVVGTRGAGGLRRAVLGSTSLHVVNHARQPVLVVREAADDAT